MHTKMLSQTPIFGINTRALSGRPAVLFKLVLILVISVIALNAQPALGQYFVVLHSFDGNDGANPYSGLVLGTDGNFYGTTYDGGPPKCFRPGNYCGTIFKITPSGTLTTLHDFNLADGANPHASLVQATDGNLYGTTTFGGDLGCNRNGYGCGTVFRITPSGALTTLHNFGSGEGDFPYAPLLQASDGNFYGTTVWGGANGDGTVFKITSTGALTTLHSFLCSQSGCPDGTWPYASLVQAVDGNLYGTTPQGGTNGDGTVFKITPSGTLTTLHNFAYADGFLSEAGLMQATDGNFYGTTAMGGNPGCNGNGCGTVLKITPAGALTTLYRFCSQANCADGALPYSTLVQGHDGFLYGTTRTGGTYGYGTVFRVAMVPKCATCRP